MRRRISETAGCAAQQELLLLFFAVGALVARLAPALLPPIPGERLFYPALYMSLALLSGSVLGPFGIPLAAFLFGQQVMHRLSALGLPEREALLPWACGLLPFLWLLPLFFAMAWGAMRWSAGMLRAAEEGRAFSRRVLLRRQLLMWSAAAAAAAMSAFFICGKKRKKGIVCRTQT